MIALYHDQGLIPLKLLAFDEGVNTTIGLPIQRSSPDHGTAYDIAGKKHRKPHRHDFSNKLYSIHPIMKQHTKTLGQVFLHDQNIINKIITLASPTPNQPIIEIGCGKGILTQALANTGPVNVIEIDERWINHVSDLNLKNVTFTHIDALKVDYGSFPKGTPIIANIPYQITSPLIELFTQYNHHLGPITIMIQKEMAERLVATPSSKRYGSMTIFCNYYFNVNKGFGVSRNCFTPPNVDSQVIQLTAKSPLTPRQ